MVIGTVLGDDIVSQAAAGTVKFPIANRLGALFAATVVLASKLAYDRPPIAIAVEDAFGPGRTLKQAQGCVLGALAMSFHGWPTPPAIWTVAQGRWRTDLGLRARSTAENKALSIAAVKDLGYTPESHDHADAINIARWVEQELETT